MFLIPGIAALLAFVYVRPHEVFEVLRQVTLNWILLTLVLAYVLDLRLGFTRPRPSPIAALLGLVVLLSVVSLLIKAPDAFAERFFVFGVAIGSYFFVSQGLQSLRALTVGAAILLATNLVLTGVGVHQGLSPPVCFLQNPGVEDSAAKAVEGRSCTGAEQCAEAAPLGAEFVCEHPGILGTRSVGGRVRYLGLLEDPNELAMAISTAIPLAFALFQLRRSRLRLATLLLALVGGFVCVIMTKSRSGQLSMLAALGVYFIRRFGRGGAVAGGILALPLLLLGGRSGEEADSSSDERLECWRAALDMWRENPLLGVGQGQFVEHHYLTAHNSVWLTLAELGPLGLLCWTATVYVSFKIVVRASIDFRDQPQAAEVQIWATALLASLSAMVISAFFLSIAYHPVVWIFFALVAAYYAAIQNHQPGWKVRFGWRDLVAVAAFDVVLVAGMALYLQIKGI